MPRLLAMAMNNDREKNEVLDQVWCHDPATAGYAGTTSEIMPPTWQEALAYLTNKYVGRNVD